MEAVGRRMDGQDQAREQGRKGRATRAEGGSRAAIQTRKDVGNREASRQCAYTSEELGVPSLGTRRHVDEEGERRESGGAVCGSSGGLSGDSMAQLYEVGADDGWEDVACTAAPTVAQS